MKLAIVIVAAVLAGCATAPQSPRPPLTAGQREKTTERLIAASVAASARAGHDSYWTYLSQTNMSCADGSITNEQKCAQVAQEIRYYQATLTTPVMTNCVNTGVGATCTSP